MGSLLALLATLASPASLLDLLEAPTTDEGNRIAAATLPDREECDDDLAFQPYDCPERARWALLTISNRESPYGWSPSRRWVGVHSWQGDHRHSPGLGRWARKSGRFSWWCPAHYGDRGFSTVGPHGLMYTYNVQRLGVPGNCVPWWVFAMPIPSAHAALDRYVDRCEDEPPEGKRSWCPRIEAVQATMDRWFEREARALKRARRAARRAKLRRTATERPASSAT